MLEDPYEQIQVPGGLNKVSPNVAIVQFIFSMIMQMLVHPNSS